MSPAPDTPRAVRKLLALLTGREKRQLAALLGIQILVALLETAGIASIMPFVAVVTNPDTIENNAWLLKIRAGLGIESPSGMLILLGVVVLALVVVGNAAKTAALWYGLNFENELNYQAARRLLERYMSRPYTFFLNRNSAELGKNVLSEVRIVVGGVLSPWLKIIASSLVALAIVGLLLAVDPTVAIVIAVTLSVVYGAVFVSTRRKLGRIAADQIKANTEKYKAAGEALHGIKDVKVLGREGFFLERFARHADRHARNNVSAGVFAELPRYALETISFGGIVVILLTILVRGDAASEAIPLAALYAFAGYRLLPAFQQIYSSITTYRFNLPSLDMLYEDFGAATAAASTASAALAEAGAALPIRQSLRLEQAWFTYPGAPGPALQGVSLDIPVDTTVAFVGPTGSGKTTIVDVILGLLPLDGGQVLVDNMPLDGGNLRAWQKSLGYVPQQIYLTDDTIRRNIALGLPDEAIDHSAVERAARLACIHDFVCNDLPAGYDTVVGDRGVRLSGGQRQRIGIARALYHNPGVLILDEATSALDGVTEEAIMDAIRSLAGRKTIIVIAHRLSTVQQADRIYLLERGVVGAVGTYNDLLKASRWFRAAAGGAEEKHTA